MTKCKIKIEKMPVDLSKKGNAGVHMIFQKDKRPELPIIHRM